MMLASDWQNAASPLDIDADGFVSPIDALIPINELNSPTLLGDGNRLPDRLEFPNAPWFDTNADCLLTPIDVLLVINTLNLDREGPLISAQMAQDTAPAGATNDDGITSDPMIVGSVTDLSGVQLFQASVDSGEFFNVDVTIGGDFTLDPQIAVDGSQDGLHRIHFRAEDGIQQTTLTELVFTLDTIAPAPVTSLQLQATSDTGSSNSDGVTSDNTPAFSIEASPGTTVELLADGVVVGTGVTSSLASVTSSSLADGAFEFSSRSVDVAGNTTAAIGSQVVSIDTVQPQLLVSSPTANGIVHRASQLQGTVDDATSVVLSYSIDSGASHIFASNAVGEFTHSLFGSQIDDGSHVLDVTAVDLAGNATSTSLVIDVQRNAVPFSVSGHSPQNGSEEIGVTQRVQTFFSKPVDPATLNNDNFFASYAGNSLPATLVPAGNGEFAWLFFNSPMPGSANITVNIIGDSIQSLDGETLDGNGDGTPGGTYQFSFSTVSTTPLPGTSLTGLVMDPGPDNRPHTADDLPLPGVEVFLLGLESTVRTTNTEGRFTFDSVPAGNAKVVIDGLTASAPSGTYFPEMVMDAFMDVGQANFVMAGMEEVYLPRLNESILQAVDGSQATTIVADEDAAPDLSPADRTLLSIDIPPNSLIASNGSSVSTAQIGISTVPPELVVDMLPPGILQHTFDITVQAIGVSNFSTPVPLTVPNVFDAEPGTQLNFLSFDHSSGRLVIEGTMTVSADGSQATTDPGFGITHPGWHGATPPGSDGCGERYVEHPPLAGSDEIVTIHPPNVLPMITGQTISPLTLSWESPNAGNSATELISFSGCRGITLDAEDLADKEYLEVHIQVDGPLSSFMKKSGISQDLVSQSFILLEGKQQRFEFNAVAKSYEELFAPNKFSDFYRDILYGSAIKVTEIRVTPGESGASATVRRDVYTHYLYRWIGVVDAEEAKLREGNNASFHHTFADGKDGFVRQKDVWLRLPLGTETQFTTDPESPFDYGGIVAGNGVARWTFDPLTSLPGGLSYFDTVDVEVKTTDEAGAEKILKVGQLDAKARATEKTTINIDLDGFRDRLSTVIVAQIRAINPGKDLKPGKPNHDDDGNGIIDDDVELMWAGTDDRLDVVYGHHSRLDAFRGPVIYVGADNKPGKAGVDDDNNGKVDDAGELGFPGTDDTTARVVQLSSKRNDQGQLLPGGKSVQNYTVAGARFRQEFAGFLPGDTYTIAELDARVETEAQRLLAAVTADYAAVNAAAGVEAFEIVQTGGDVTMNWRDLGPIKGGSANYDSAEELNPPNSFLRPLFCTPGTNYDFGNTKPCTVDISDAAKEWAVAEALNHDVNDTGRFAVALNTTWTSSVTLGQKIANVVSHEIAHTFGLNDAYLNPNNVPVSPVPDLMNSITPSQGDLSFGTNNMMLLRAAVGAHPNGERPITNAFLMYRRNINLPGSARGAIEKIDPNFEYSAIGVVQDSQQLFPGNLVDLAGTDGEPIVKEFVVTNQGNIPLNIGSIAFATEKQEFTLDAAAVANRVLQPSESAAMSVTFDSDAPGLFSNLLRVTSSDGQFPQFDINLHAEILSKTAFVKVDIGSDATDVFNVMNAGLAPHGGTSNNNLGGVAIGSSVTLPKLATITNFGAEPLSITDVRTVEGSDEFSLVGVPADLATNPIQLSTGERKSFGVIFQPGTTGLHRILIDIHTDDPAMPVYRISAIGTGMGPSVVPMIGDDYVRVSTPELENSPVNRLHSDRSGNFSVFLPPDARYHLTVFEPETQLVSNGFGRTAVSGGSIDLTSTLVFGASLARDSDYDGLPDDIESAIGTSNDNVDTNGDGISDFDSLQAGIDPLAGLNAQTGPIGILPLGHPANEVVVATHSTDLNQHLAYVATGDVTGGLAVVDVTDPTTPIILSELQLPGNSFEIKVDSARNQAAVWNGVQTHLVDISDPTMPMLQRSIDNTGRSEFFHGFMYVVQGTKLVSMNLETGKTHDDRALASEGSITDLARLGNFLYTMSGSGRLRIFELATDGSGRMTERGEIRIFGTFGRIFIDDKVAYLMTTTGNRRPFITVDVSNPDTPTLLSEEDGGIILPRTDFAAGGSPFGYLIGHSIVAPFDQRLSVIDISDPASDTPQLTAFTLPEQPRGLSLGAGVAFVAVGTNPGGTQTIGTGALHVLNFPGFDSGNQPPTVTVTIPADHDSAAGGIQIIEGSSIPIFADVLDDVQIRSVELLVNGEVVAKDINAPWEFDSPIPTIQELTTAAVQVRAFDTGGSASLSNTLSIELIPDNISPQVSHLEPIDGGFRPAGTLDVRIGFSEDLSLPSLDQSLFKLFDSSNNEVTPTSVSLTPREVTLVLANAVEDTYRLTVSDGIVDRTGNPLGMFSSSFTVDSGTVFWANDVGGLWHDPTNWSTGVVPGPTDDVIIGVDGEIDILIDSSQPRPTVNRLYSEERIVADGGLTLNGPSELIGGLASHFGESRSLLTFNAETIVGGRSDIGAKIDGSGTLTNRGRWTFIDGETSQVLIPFANESHVLVDAATVELSKTSTNSGVWEFRAPATMGDRGGLFDNQGEVTFTSPLAKVTFSVPFDNTGQAISVPSKRELSLRGGGTWTDTTVDIDQLGRIEILGFDTTFSNVMVSGSGTFTTLGGSLTVPEDTASTFDLSGNTLELGGSQGGVFDLIIAGTLTNMGTAVWHGANLEIGPTGAFNNQGLLELRKRNRSLTGQFNNTGTVEYIDLGSLNMEGATINNSGLWDFQGANTVVNRSGLNAFNNTGQVYVSGTATTKIEVPLHNSSLVDVMNGVLWLTGGGTQDNATLRVAAGARTDLSNGDIIVTGTTTFAGLGLAENTRDDIVVNASATLNLGMTGDGFSARSSLAQDGLIVAGTANNTGILNLSRGAIAVNGSFVNTGTVTWTGNARLKGDGFVNKGLLDIAGAFFGTIEAGTITNEGMMYHRGSHALTLFDGTIVNKPGAVMEISGPGGFAPGFASPNHTIDNAGLFRRTAGTTNILVDVGFDNSGNVELLGDVLFADGFNQSAGMTKLMGANLSVNAQQVNVQGGTFYGEGKITGSITNSGKIEVGGKDRAGALEITGNFTQTAAGALAIEIGGTAGGAFDVLTTNSAVGNQTTALGGTLNVLSLGGFAANVNDEFAIMFFDSIAGDFAATNGTNLPNGTVLVPQVDASSYTLLGTAPLLIEASPQQAAMGESTVDAAVVADVFAGLLERLAGHGVSSEQLAPLFDTRIRVTDLADDQLALAGGGLILIDEDAASSGWFVDDTPYDNLEFHRVDGNLVARSDGKAHGRVDLLSVLAHELAHLLGEEHDETGLMAPSISRGQRRDIDEALLALF